MKKYTVKIISLFLCMCIIAGFSLHREMFASAETLPEVSSPSVIAVSAESGKVLFSSGTDIKQPAGVITKLMTAVVVMEQADLEGDLVPSSKEMVTVGAEINTLPSGVRRAGLDVGEEISVQNLLYAMLLHGGDDAAIALAAYFGRKALGGSPSIMYEYDKVAVDYFVTLMNDKAKKLGLSGSLFLNPCGYTQEGHYATAADAAKIGVEFAQYEYLCKITSTLYLQYEDWSSRLNGRTDLRYWESMNPFIDSEDAYYDADCKGLAADSTGIAVLVERNGFGVIVIAMNTALSRASADAQQVIDYAYNNYVMYRPVEEGMFICEQYVENAMDASNEHVTVCATASDAYLTKAEDVDKYTFERRFRESYYQPTVENLSETYLCLEAPIVKGDILGTMDIYFDGDYVDTVTLYAGETVEAYRVLIETRVLSWWQKLGVSNIIYIVVVATFLALIVIFIIKIKRNLQMMRAAKRKYKIGKRAKGSVQSNKYQKKL